MTQESLIDKVVIVTGAARGMGTAIAKALLDKGASVIATDISPFEKDLWDSYPNVLTVSHDVADQAAWADIVDQAFSRFGHLDALVNNAGVFMAASIEATESAQVELAFRVNQLGVFLGMKAMIEPFKAAGGGSIVNIASCVATRGVTDQFAYAASKWAVRGMTKCAALELAKHNIRVNSINPGPTDTPMTASFGKQHQAFLQGLIPLGRLGAPQDVANVVAFLLKDDASFISGTEVDVDGALFA